MKPEKLPEEIFLDECYEAGKIAVKKWWGEFDAAIAGGNGS